MQKMWLSIFLLLPKLCFAGVDFSMMGSSGIPEFNTEQEAIAWARDTKWVEEYRQELRSKRVEIIRTISDMNASDKSKEIERLLDQWSRYNAALNVMEGYKKMNVKGASFYGGSIPMR